jgi:hypothetical protein
MSRRPGTRRVRAVVPIVGVLVVLVAGSCSGDGTPPGADGDRPPNASIDTVRFVDVATEVGVDFHHGAFRFGATGDPFSMMGGGVCWIDVDADGWLDLFTVNTWTSGEWGRWRVQGALPTTHLYHNDRGRFRDVSDEWGAALEVRGSGCVAADLDRDGYTDLYVTTERENVLLWNDGGDHFVTDDGTAGVDAYGWHAGAAVGDVNGDGWQDLFVAGYADLTRPVTGATKGFPNPFSPEPDLLYLNQGAQPGQRPTFVEVASAVGIEHDRVDYGLGATWADVDRDGDLDLYVANDTQPNRLYVNEPDTGAHGFRLTDRGADANVDDDEAGMGIAVGDYDGDGRSDIVVTNLTGQGHAAFRSVAGGDPWAFEPALAAMGLPDLGQERTGWGVTWADIDLDGDLDLLVAHGAIPVRDPDADRDQLEVFENRTVQGQLGRFADVTSLVGLVDSGRFLARGLAAADYDNDGDVDIAVGTIGGRLALLRNTGAGGHWLEVAPSPSTPGTIVAVTTAAGIRWETELHAGSSYLSSEDPRTHVGLGADDTPVTVEVSWPDGSGAVRSDVESDQVVVVRPD